MYFLVAEALELHQLNPPYEGGSDTYLPPAICGGQEWRTLSDFIVELKLLYRLSYQAIRIFY